MPDARREQDGFRQGDQSVPELAGAPMMRACQRGDATLDQKPNAGRGNGGVL